MLYSVLAVGDVVGEAGLAHLERHLRPLQKLKNISFTVVNGENISGVGLTCKQAWRVYDAGADAVTLGNHTFGKMEIGRMLDETPWLLRPANLSGRMPGHGCEIFDLNGLRFRVVNLIGRCTLQWNAENPFTLADRLLKQGTADFTLVDFHAEATSEKLALGYYLDGRVSALWGTHTHVPTADERVYPKGTGYITDLGMTGPIESVLGVESAQSVESFLGGLPGRYRNPEGPCKLQGAIFTLDSATGLCTAVERVDIREGGRCMTRPEHYRFYSAVFPILLRSGPHGQEVLLHLRQNTGYMDGCWDFAGSGHVDENETARQAVARECLEELGITVDPADAEFVHLCHRVAGGDGRTYYDLCFVIRKYDGTPAVMEPEKNAGLRWFPTEALPENTSTAVEVMLRPCLRGQPYSEVIHDLPVTSI